MLKGLVAAIVNAVDALRNSEGNAAWREVAAEELETALQTCSPDEGLLRAAEAMLAKLDNITTDDFAIGAERPEREALQTVVDHARKCTQGEGVVVYLTHAEATVLSEHFRASELETRVWCAATRISDALSRAVEEPPFAHLTRDQIAAIREMGAKRLADVASAGTETSVAHVPSLRRDGGFFMVNSILTSPDQPRPRGGQGRARVQSLER